MFICVLKVKVSYFVSLELELRPFHTNVNEKMGQKFHFALSDIMRTEAYSEVRQTSKMECLAKIVNSF